MKELTLKQTCIACPEQYDVFHETTLVGYIRLRWGHFAVTTPNIDGKVVFEHQFKDGFKGGFNNEKERTKYLNIAKDKIIKELSHEKPLK